MTATKAAITLGGTSLTCKGSGTITLTTGGGEEEAPEGNATLGFTECKSPGGTCGGSGGFNLDPTYFEGAGGNGSVTIGGGVTFVILCTTPLAACGVVAEEASFEFTGGNPATMVKEGLALKVGGVGCPYSTASLHSEWTVTSPSSLFIV